MDRPVKEARMVLEPLENVSQEEVDHLVSTTWNNNLEEEEEEEDIIYNNRNRNNNSNNSNRSNNRNRNDKHKSNRHFGDNMKASTNNNSETSSIFSNNNDSNIPNNTTSPLLNSNSNSPLKISRRRRSLSNEVNADPDNPVLSFVRELINKSEREEAPIEHKELKDSVVSEFGIETYKRQSLAINLLFRSIEEQNYIHDEIISNSRERALSMSSQSQASSYGGYDSPHLSRSSGIHDECIGCNDPEMEIQLKRHLSELESLI